MRTEVIKADNIDEATERILDELNEDPATTTRSISSRNNVIYFDGWDGLGASAVLRAVAKRLTAMASSEAPAGLQFDQIIHIDCSKWESRRALQRTVAEQLGLPAPVMDMFDRQDEEDDFSGIADGSRTEIPQVLRAMFQRIQERNRRFLVIFHNGSMEEMDLAIFGFLLSGYSTNKVLWTFQGKLRLQPRMKVVKVIETKEKTDVFLSASTRHEEDARNLLSFLVHQEATEVATSLLVDNNIGGASGREGIVVNQPASQVVECFLHMLRLCCLGYHFNMVGDYDYDMATHSCNYWMCDAIIRQEGQGETADGGDASWQAADALRLAMPFDVDYYLHDHPYLPPSHLIMWCNNNNNNNSIASQPGTPFSSPNSYCHLPVPAIAIPNADIFQCFDNKLSVLKLCGRTFSLSSPPFIYCHKLKFLWLDHCQVQDTDTTGEEEAMIRRFFQKLWVLDVRYTHCDGILSPRFLDFMTQLRELNVMGAQHWDIGQLQGGLPNIRKLRVTKSTVCTSCSENNLLLGMNKMELLDFSGNRTMQCVTEFSQISTNNICLETVVIFDGCAGQQRFSFRGCAKLKNLLLSGLFEDLRTLDLSGTAVKTLDLSAMTARSLTELILDNCDKLCAILWPPKDKRNMDLAKVHINTTQSATSRSGEEKMKAGSTSDTGSSSSSSWPMVLVNGAQPPSEFNWYISIKDARLLRSFVPSFEKYFQDHLVHLEISSPSCCPNVDVGGTENIGSKTETGGEPQLVVSNRERQQPQYNNNASMYYADVAAVIVEEDLLQGGEGNDNDAPTITRTRPCPPPFRRLDSSDCYLYTQDQQMKKTKATMDGGANATIPSIICDSTSILHVHDSLYNTSIPGPAQWEVLRWCRVERCPRLEFIFTAPQLGGGSNVRMCWGVITFWASQLPRTRFMWDTSKLPLSKISNRSFEEVKLLHLDFCPRLIQVLPFSSSVSDRRYLETLEIVWCGDLRVVFPLLDTNIESHQKQQRQHKPPPPGAIKITTVYFPNLKHIHLHELPMLESICGLGRMYAPKLETIKIRGCWNLKHLPAVSSDRSNNKVECDCEKEWWDRLEWEGLEEWLEWDGLDGKHHPSLYKPIHSRYYKKKLLRGSVLI